MGRLEVTHAPVRVVDTAVVSVKRNAAMLGASGFAGDICIGDGSIAAIGRVADDAAQEIDTEVLTVCPGVAALGIMSAAGSPTSPPSAASPCWR